MIGKAVEKLAGKMSRAQNQSRQYQQGSPAQEISAVQKASTPVDPLNNTSVANRNAALDAYKTQFGTPQAIASAGGYASWIRKAASSPEFREFERNYSPAAPQAAEGAANTSASPGAATGTPNPVGGNGLLSSAVGGAISQATAAGVQPMTREVAADELASNQLDKLLSKDSALSQRAMTAGKQYAASRGLLNSSMGAEAAYGSWVDRATPIAMDDAGKYTNVLDKNMDATNQFRLSDKQFGFDLELQSNEQAWRTGENKLDRALTASEGAADRAAALARESMAIAADDARFDKDIAFRTKESALGREFDLARDANNQAFTAGQAQLDREFNRETQLTAAELEADARLTQHLYALEELGYRFNLDQYNVSKTYAANSASALYTSIANILADPNLEQATKNSAINNAIAVFNDQMKFGSTIYGTPLPGWGDTTTQPNNTIPAPPNSAKIQQASSWVQDAFQTYLGRQPAAGGLEYWTQQAVANGWTKEQTAAYIRQSAIDNGELSA